VYQEDVEECDEFEVTVSRCCDSSNSSHLSQLRVCSQLSNVTWLDLNRTRDLHRSQLGRNFEEWYLRRRPLDGQVRNFSPISSRLIRRLSDIFAGIRAASSNSWEYAAQEATTGLSSTTFDSANLLSRRRDTTGISYFLAAPQTHSSCRSTIRVHHGIGIDDKRQ
jgi:hypothetical protein